MKKSTGFIIKGIILVIVIALFGGYYIKNNKKDKGIVVKEWNNLYNENNITLYYENINNNMKESLVNLNNTYNILEIVQKEEGELNKVLKTVDIVNSIVNYDDVANSRSTDAYNILKGKGENRKVSFRDMAIISRDIILVSGYEARVGIFRNGAAEYSKNQQYYVVEYWSNEYNKWIMIDFRDKGYFKKEETPLSAIEIIDSSLKNIEYIGNTKEDKYKKSLKKYLESYHMAIENRLSITRSNSNLAYVKNEKSIIVKLYNEYMPPTIFTTDATLFNNKPGIIAQEKDEKIYIILMEKTENDKEYNVNNNTYIVDAFKNSKVIDNYYIRVNNEDFQLVENYKEIEIGQGETTIEVSIDGVNPCSSIKLQNSN